ncbi:MULTISPECIES: hypothetical protein [unclassified Frankia]|uniref:hypothetical protein n=1 Tax=unclassified Frankia TaxID=2632575 RepID=UPI002AD3B695|nr:MULTISPECIES: hypothetical protein [unclassified Frankia]
MNAETTACRVLAWAGDTAGWSAPPPVGPLRETSALAHPAAATLTVLRELTRDTAARLGAGSPPFADRSPVGAGALLLAAAVGGRAQAGPARALAEAAPALRPATDGWADALARHAVVAPTLAACRAVPELADTLLRASTLTAVLFRPAASRVSAGATATEVAAATDLLGRPRGRAVVTAALAGWSPDPAVLTWRAELLTRLSHDHPGVVLDTYLLARLRHGVDWDRRLTWAARALSGFGLPDDLPVATVGFWAPLAALDQRDPELIRSRTLLDGHRDALNLVRRYRLGLSAGAA